jgi:hypothetical protein
MALATGWLQQRFQSGPLRIRQIARVHNLNLKTIAPLPIPFRVPALVFKQVLRAFKNPTCFAQKLPDPSGTKPRNAPHQRWLQPARRRPAGHGHRLQPRCRFGSLPSRKGGTTRALIRLPPAGVRPTGRWRRGYFARY